MPWVKEKIQVSPEEFKVHEPEQQVLGDHHILDNQAVKNKINREFQYRSNQKFQNAYNEYRNENFDEYENLIQEEYQNQDGPLPIPYLVISIEEQ